MQIMEGTTLGRYRLQRLIGHGGMAEVYLASDAVLNREVAIKIVHHDQEDDLARFQREAETVGPLVHEHILPVFDYGQEGPWHYLVMPYIQGGTLADRLKTRGPLSPTEADILLEQIANALQYAHERGILHRDIKTSNILLRDDTYAYLSDFGIARSLELVSELTQAGTIIGTPEYMAPELVDRPASQSSDIYALGIVLYSMLVGHLPFTAPNSVAVFQKQLHESPPSLTEYNPTIPRPAEEVVLVALAKDPQRRFQSVLAFSNAYHQALQIPSTPVPLLHAHPAFYNDTTVAAPVVQPLAPGTPLTPATGRSAHSHLNAVFIAFSALALILILAFALMVGRLVNQSGTQAATRATATVSLGAKQTPSPQTGVPTKSCVVTNHAPIALDTNQICAAAQDLRSSLEVNSGQNGSQDGNDAYHVPQVFAAPGPHTIVISIIASQKHGHGHVQAQVHITGGSEVPLNDAQYHAAVDAFSQTLKSGDYTSATIAAIQVLRTDGA